MGCCSIVLHDALAACARDPSQSVQGSTPKEKKDKIHTRNPISEEHIETWCNQKLQVEEKELKRFLCLAHDLRFPHALQVAFFCCRVRYPARIVRLFPTLSISHMLPFAESMQTMLTQFMSVILHTSSFSAPQHRLLVLPIQRGGLGLPSFAIHACVARLASLSGLVSGAEALSAKCMCSCLSLGHAWSA